MKIKAAVKGFFGDRETVFATIGTTNHSANFYGDDLVCELSRGDVESLIALAATSWYFPDEDDDALTGDDAVEAAINAVLDDLQHDRPEVD